MTYVPHLSDLPLSPALMPGLEAPGCAELTPIQALAPCPTRELADQVGKQLRKLATGIHGLKQAEQALARLRGGKIKGRGFRGNAPWA